MRDRRRLSRDRDIRERRDDSRDRARRRREGSTDSKRKGRRDSSKGRGDDRNGQPKRADVSFAHTNPGVTICSLLILQSPGSSTANKQLDEEKKKAERLAKLEAWKAKQAAEKEKKLKELALAGGTRGLLEEMDKKAAGSPTVASPPGPQSPAGTASPAPYAGKFDPKTIAKKATTVSTAPATLGTDVAVPVKAKQPAKGPPAETKRFPPEKFTKCKFSPRALEQIF